MMCALKEGMLNPSLDELTAVLPEHLQLGRDSPLDVTIKVLNKRMGVKSPLKKEVAAPAVKTTDEEKDGG